MNNVQNYKSLPIVGQGGLVFLYLCDMKKYVDVIVPLPIAGQYTYSLPEGWDEKVKEGCGGSFRSEEVLYSHYNQST